MLEKKIKDIVEVLKKSNEFCKVQQALNNLEKNIQSKRRVEQFTEDSAKASRLPKGGGKSFQEDLERRYTEMMQIPEIAAYFSAVEQFGTTVADLHQYIDDLICQALEDK